MLRGQAPGGSAAERTARGLLIDLVADRDRDLGLRSGFAVERGRFGVWILGEQGGVLVRRGGRRVHCYCVKVTDRAMPPGDRVAHLLLALRADEAGFATVANRVFSGARWRLAHRLSAPGRDALDVARRAAMAGA